MDQNRQPPKIKPLASKISSRPVPIYLQNLQQRNPNLRVVSNLRVNRAIHPKEKEREAITPIRGERKFEPSWELQSQIEAQKRTETQIPITPIWADNLSPEERNQRINEAKQAYEDQIYRLREKESQISEKFEKAQEELQKIEQNLQTEETPVPAQPKEEIEDLSLRYQKLQEEISSKENQWQKALQELQNAKKNNSQENQEHINLLEQQITSYQANLTQLKEKEQALNQHIQQKDQEVQQLTASNQEKEEIIRTQQEELENAKQQLTQQIQTKEKEFEQQKNLLEKLRQETQDQNSQQILQMENQIQEQQNYVNQLKQKEQNLAQQIQSAEETISQLSASNQEKEKLIIQQQEELKQARLALRNQIINQEKAREEKEQDLKQSKQTEQGENAEQLHQLEKQISTYQIDINRLKEKKNEMTQKIQQTQSEIERNHNVISVLDSQNKEKEALIEKQQQELTDLRRDKEKISRFANELVEKLSQVENLQRVENTIKISKKEEDLQEEEEKYQSKVIKEPLVAEDYSPLTNKENAISGIISDQDGNPLEGVLVVIKNKDQQPQRALRTNKVGEFVVASPLSNGTYRLEVQKDGYRFDIIEMVLTGELLQPIRIKSV